MKTAECRFEPLEDMRKRLGSSGAVEQIKAVQKSIKLISSASGCLDHCNARAAIYHLAVALVGECYAPELLDSFGEEP